MITDIIINVSLQPAQKSNGQRLILININLVLLESKTKHNN